MFGVKIQDKKLWTNGGSSLSFDLKDILAVIGEPVIKSRWRCYDLDCTTRADNGKFGGFSKDRIQLSGEEILEFAAGISQTIDGRFEAQAEGASKKSWLRIVAFDSSWFEVWSSKAWAIEKIKQRFENVSDIKTNADEHLNYLKNYFAMK